MPPDAPLLLGVDLGTSSLKAVVVNARDNVVATASVSYPLHRPQPGWAEQEPHDWWAALHTALADLRAAGVALAQVAAVGLTGQMHGMVLLDAHGETLGACHTWADARCAVEARHIERRIGRARLIAEAGSRANTSATAAKLLWVRQHEPERWRAARHLLLPKDYLRWRLTGALATDPSDASGTLLCDLASRGWSSHLLAALDLPHGLLPPISESTTVAGTVTSAAALTLGLPAGIPVMVCGGDAECAAVGMGLTGAPQQSGTALATLGTSGQFFVALARPQVDPTGRLQALCHAIPGRWHLMGALLSGASALDWLTQALGGNVSAAMLLTEAAREPVGARGLLFLPHLHGTRMPDMNADARGAFIGLAPEHTRGAMARAVVEGVVLALGEGLAAMRALNLPVERVLLAGGANRHPLWAQVQADVFGVPAHTRNAAHASAHGAARLAAVGIGHWPTVDALVTEADDNADDADGAAPAIYRPNPRAVARYAALAPVAQRLHARLHGTYASLATFRTRAADDTDTDAAGPI